MPASIRPAFATLWNLDLALADVVSTSTDPHLGAIRLAWWRDRLDELDSGGPIAGEPRLSAINRHLMPITSGAALSTIATAWAPLLEPFPWGEDVADGLRERGRLVFAVGARILDANQEAEPAGALWSLADGALHCSDPDSREFLLSEARAAIADVPRKMPRTLRPLTVLSALAADDVLHSGRLTRVAAAMRHRWSGTIPR
jgi:phytoene synthase